MNTETQQKVKLTKAALNKFIVWSTTRYNDYLGFGKKEDAVQNAYDSLINMQEGTVFIECASGVGESNTRNWSTKQVGGQYLIDCKSKSITETNTNKVIFFIVPERFVSGLSNIQEQLIKQIAGVDGSAKGVKHFKKHKEPKSNRLYISPDPEDKKYLELKRLCELGYLEEGEKNGYAMFSLTAMGISVAAQLVGIKV